MYLLDTNTIIYHLKGSLPVKAKAFLNSIVDEQSMVSVISKIEVLGFNYYNNNEQIIAETFINNSIVFDINDTIVKTTIALRKDYKIKLPDAIITATALVYNLSLITHNISDFNKIPSLKILDPFQL